jgi:O-antigen ligase
MVPMAPAGFAPPRAAWGVATSKSLGEGTRVYPIVTFMFCVMIASFPIELPQRTFRWEVPTITTTLFLLISFLQPAKCFARVHTGLLLLLGYVFAFAASALAHGWSRSLELSQLFLFLVQALLVAWSTFNLMQHDHIARKALWCFVAACVIRTMMPMLGLAEHSAYVESSTGAERVTAFGQDPNYSAILLSAALLITIGLTHGPSRKSLRARAFAWALAGFFAVAIVNTGSRGGLLALVAGLVSFAFTRARNPLERLRSTLIVVVSMLALGYFVANSYVMRKRIERTATEGGAMAGRELLFPALWGMFHEKPFTGWGPVNNQYEVVKRATELIKRPEQMTKDAHNLYLELLTSTGLLGAIPFFLAMMLCVRAAWRARDGHYGILPLAVMCVFLVANISLNQVVHKPFWMFMAFALAAERRTWTEARRAAATVFPRR